MKVFIATIGTRGDVQPYVALAEGLRGAGHAVTVCTSPRYESLITGRGLDYGYLSDDLVALVETPRGREAIAAAGGTISGLRSLFALIRESLQIQRDLFRDGWAAAREAEPDLIVYHPKMAIALHYAERMDIPAAMAALFPTFHPTGAYPNPGFPELPFGGRPGAAYNRATHRLVLGAVSAASRRMSAAWRSSEGLPARLPRRSVIQRHDGAFVPMLNGWSRHVVPETPGRTGGHAETTGYWFLQSHDDWRPSAALAAFLDAGPPPVYVGFGSMAGRRPGRRRNPRHPRGPSWSARRRAARRPPRQAPGSARGVIP